MDADQILLIKLISACLLFVAFFMFVGLRSFKGLAVLYFPAVFIATIVVPSYSAPQSCGTCHNFTWYETFLISLAGYPILCFLGLLVASWTDFDLRFSHQKRTDSMSPYEAMCIMEQRKSSRNLGNDIHAVLPGICDWSEWRYAASIWEREQTKNNYGVTISFENPGHIPTYDRGGYIVPTNPNVFREGNYQGNNQLTAQEIAENKWKTW